jgi:hypothetical protein
LAKDICFSTVAAIDLLPKEAYLNHLLRRQEFFISTTSISRPPLSLGLQIMYRLVNLSFVWSNATWSISGGYAVGTM